MVHSGAFPRVTTSPFKLQGEINKIYVSMCPVTVFIVTFKTVKCFTKFNKYKFVHPK